VTDGASIADHVIPGFARGMKFRYDTIRDIWVVLGPERMFQPDETAVEVLKLVDGRRSFTAIIDDLCGRFAAPRDVVAADVAELLRDLQARGVVTL
jgi:pyrroloquinoline quinone biosynthesis protein D